MTMICLIEDCQQKLYMDNPLDHCLMDHTRHVAAQTQLPLTNRYGARVRVMTCGVDHGV